MSRDEFRNHYNSLGCAAVTVVILGVVFLGFFSPFFFFGGLAILLIVPLYGLYKERSIKWVDVTCPYCGQSFQVEPKDDLALHFKCKHKVVIKNGKAYKMGEVPIDHP